MTATARLNAEDIERARVIGAVRQQSASEVIHAALDEYVANHRDELEGLFLAVQAAVLSGDREGLRSAFRGEAERRGADDARRSAEAWSEDTSTSG